MESVTFTFNGVPNTAFTLAICGVPDATANTGGMRPMRLPEVSVNHRLPSGPAAIESGLAPAVMPVLNSATIPSVVMRPILPFASTNQRLPSGPAAIPASAAPGVTPALNSVITPAGVTRPIRWLVGSVYHRFHGSGRDTDRTPQGRDAIFGDDAERSDFSNFFASFR